jgi:uncharacterized protein YjcR
MAKKARHISRKELYDLVWREPRTPYGANIRTSRMIFLSDNITDNLFAHDKRHTTIPPPRNRPGRLA